MMHIQHHEIIRSYRMQIRGVKAGNVNRKGTITAEMYAAKGALAKLVGHEPASKWARISDRIVKRITN